MQGPGSSEQGLSALPGEGGKLSRRGDMELRRGGGFCREGMVGGALQAGGTACAVAQRLEAFGLFTEEHLAWNGWRMGACSRGRARMREEAGSPVHMKGKLKNAACTQNEGPRWDLGRRGRCPGGRPRMGPGRGRPHGGDQYA